MQNSAKIPNSIYIQCHLLQCDSNKSIYVQRSFADRLCSVLNLVMQGIKMVLRDLVRHDMLFKSTRLFIHPHQDILKLHFCILPFFDLSTELNGLFGTVGICTSPNLECFWCECQWSVQ